MDKLSPTLAPTLKRSLNIPSQASSPPALDATSLQSALHSYTQHPDVATLDQIMLSYLGMEEILKLYSQNYEPFETRQTLGILALKYKLPTATTFKQLLRSYDMQYATVRSYLYDNRTPLKILYQAALEGEIQAMYNQLKLYPKLRNRDVYNEVLFEAAKGGHRAIIDLLLELGANKYEILHGAAEGGHLALFKEIAVTYSRGVHITAAAFLAAQNSQMEVLAYILSINASTAVLDYALRGAGESGNSKVIEYLIAKGADNYKGLVEGAAEKGHLEIFKRYLDKDESCNFTSIFDIAMLGERLNIVKYVFDEVVDTNVIGQAVGNLKQNYKRIITKLDKATRLTFKQVEELTKRRDNILEILSYLELQRVMRDRNS